MTRLVVDASVVVQWMVPHRNDEADTERALALLEEFKAGRIALHQPPHWLAEVSAVLVRLSPATAHDDVADLYSMNITVEDGPDVYWTACELAQSLRHHVFDTLYHAVAITVYETVLITADRTYYRKALRRGAIMMLNDFSET